MSDMMGMEMIFFDGFDMIFTIMFLFVIGVISITVIKGIVTWNRNNHSPQLTVTAMVAAKRMEVSHHQHANAGDITGTHGYYTTSSTFYYVTFQVDSGDRIEMAVNGAEYGMIAEGDEGLLTFQGSRYISFKRN